MSPVCPPPPGTRPGVAAWSGCTGGHTPGTRDWTPASRTGRCAQCYAGTRGLTLTCWRWWCLMSCWQINSISWFHLVSYPGLMCPGWRRRKLRLGLTIWCRDYQETADTARHRLQWSHNTGWAEGFYPRDGLMECNVHVVWWCLKHIEFNWSSLQLFA